MDSVRYEAEDVVCEVMTSVAGPIISVGLIGSSRRAGVVAPGSDLDVVAVVPDLQSTSVQRLPGVGKFGVLEDEQGRRMEVALQGAGFPIDLTVIDPSGTRTDGDPVRDRYELFLGLSLSAKTIYGMNLADALEASRHLDNWRATRGLRLRRVEAKLDATILKMRRRRDLFTASEVAELSFVRQCIKFGVFPDCSVKHADMVFPNFQRGLNSLFREAAVSVSIDRLGSPDIESVRITSGTVPNRGPR